MFFFTPQERRVAIFLAAAFFCGVCFNIISKFSPSVSAHLNVLDEPAVKPRVDINRADYMALVAVPGIGPSVAARIMYAREAGTYFSSLDELRVIKGFSKKAFSKAVPFLTIGAP